MKQTLTKYDFQAAFKAYGRDNFSGAGLDALFDYLEQYEDDCGVEVELDVISLCCEYSEYDAALDCAKLYSEFTDDHDLSIEDHDYDNDSELEGAALEFLCDRTTVIAFDGGIIIQDF